MIRYISGAMDFQISYINAYKWHDFESGSRHLIEFQDAVLSFWGHNQLDPVWSVYFVDNSGSVGSIL